jgi:hypothetical protein
MKRKRRVQLSDSDKATVRRAQALVCRMPIEPIFQYSALAAFERPLVRISGFNLRGIASVSLLTT